MRLSKILIFTWFKTLIMTLVASNLKSVVAHGEVTSSKADSNSVAIVWNLQKIQSKLTII